MVKRYNQKDWIERPNINAIKVIVMDFLNPVFFLGHAVDYIMLK